MKFEVLSNPEKAKSSTLVLLATQIDSKKGGFDLKGLSKATAKAVSDSHLDEVAKGDTGECFFLRNVNCPECSHIVVLGVGKTAEITVETIRTAGGNLLKEMKKQKVSHISLGETNFNSAIKGDIALQALLEGLSMAEYRFDCYQTKKNERAIKTVSVTTTKVGRVKALTAKTKETTAINEGVEFARLLGDTPGNLLTPTILAKEAQKASKNIKNLTVTVWDKARIKKEKLGGLMAVTAGSGQDPRMIIMEYKGAAKSKKPLCLVGKGLTFDSGGISIKPSASMDEMKYDMCGGANVIAAMTTIAKLGIKANVIAYVPSSENMPGANAIKPGDIIYARNGKSVEVLNTDAEGRLILMEALCLASEKKPAAIVDTATLTGAILVALANTYTGLFTKNEKLKNKIFSASEVASEKVWHMPLDETHTADIMGDHADLKNLGTTRGAGSSTAAAFLENFVDKSIPWAHLDIAGTAWNVSNRRPYCEVKGASGAMVKTFVELARKF